MAEYVVKDMTILHNGKKYPPGSSIKLSAKDAKRLSRFLEEPKKEEPKKEEKPTEGDKKQG